MPNQAKRGTSRSSLSASLDWLPESSWARSSFCTNGNCVEVAVLEREVFVRDSKDTSRGSIRLTRNAWTTTTQLLADSVGSVDVGQVSFSFGEPHGLTIRDTAADVSLVFDEDEAFAFILGIRSGELTA